MISEIDHLIRESFAELASDVFVSQRQGQRENEARSLYVFGYLIKWCKPGSFLHDPTQIARQVPGLAGKARKVMGPPLVACGMLLRGR